jgi:hypothetical protein
VRKLSSRRENEICMNLTKEAGKQGQTREVVVGDERRQRNTRDEGSGICPYRNRRSEISAGKEMRLEMM